MVQSHLFTMSFSPSHPGAQFPPFSALYRKVRLPQKFHQILIFHNHGSEAPFIHLIHPLLSFVLCSSSFAFLIFLLLLQIKASLHDNHSFDVQPIQNNCVMFPLECQSAIEYDISSLGSYRNLHLFPAEGYAIPEDRFNAL